MKQLILVRHAKSSWKEEGIEDHDRQLSKRGERDAPYMGRVLEEKKIDPDLIISSTATRAYSTAKEFAKKLGYKKDKIQCDKELYLAGLDELITYARSISDEYKTVMLFGHNPGITWLANFIASKEVDNIPTCGIFAVKFDISSWKEIGAGNGKLIFFEYPKMYFKDSED